MPASASLIRVIAVVAIQSTTESHLSLRLDKLVHSYTDGRFRHFIMRPHTERLVSHGN